MYKVLAVPLFLFPDVKLTDAMPPNHKSGSDVEEASSSLPLSSQQQNIDIDLKCVPSSIKNRKLEKGEKPTPRERREIV